MNINMSTCVLQWKKGRKSIICAVCKHCSVYVTERQKHKYTSLTHYKLLAAVAVVTKRPGAAMK